MLLLQRSIGVVTSILFSWCRVVCSVNSYVVPMCCAHRRRRANFHLHSESDVSMSSKMTALFGTDKRVTPQIKTKTRVLICRSRMKSIEIERNICAPQT